MGGREKGDYWSSSREKSPLFQKKRSERKCRPLFSIEVRAHPPRLHAPLQRTLCAPLVSSLARGETNSIPRSDVSSAAHGARRSAGWVRRHQNSQQKLSKRQLHRWLLVFGHFVPRSAARLSRPAALIKNTGLVLVTFIVLTTRAFLIDALLGCTAHAL